MAELRKKKNELQQERKIPVVPETKPKKVDDTLAQKTKNLHLISPTSEPSRAFSSIEGISTVSVLIRRMHKVTR
jgi:hypothetical protein